MKKGMYKCKKSENYSGYSDNLLINHVSCPGKEEDKDDNRKDIGRACCGNNHREYRKTDNQDRKARYANKNIEQSCIHP